MPTSLSSLSRDQHIDARVFNNSRAQALSCARVYFFVELRRSPFSSRLTAVRVSSRSSAGRNCSVLCLVFSVLVRALVLFIIYFFATGESRSSYDNAVKLVRRICMGKMTQCAWFVGRFCREVVGFGLEDHYLEEWKSASRVSFHRAVSFFRRPHLR